MKYLKQFNESNKSNDHIKKMIELLLLHKDKWSYLMDGNLTLMSDAYLLDSLSDFETAMKDSEDDDVLEFITVFYHVLEKTLKVEPYIQELIDAEYTIYYCSDIWSENKDNYIFVNVDFHEGTKFVDLEKLDIDRFIELFKYIDVIKSRTEVELITFNTTDDYTEFRIKIQ